MPCAPCARRYLLLILPGGAYLIDRKNQVRRFQARYPQPAPKPRPGKAPGYMVGEPHSFVLLDGEMVVDKGVETDRHGNTYVGASCLSVCCVAGCGCGCGGACSRLEAEVLLYRLDGIVVWA
jgi:hypothetical protein